MKRAIIAVANQKGGVGKTTTAVNLAVYLAKQGKRVALVDLDPQANTTSSLGYEKRDLEVTVQDVLNDAANLNDALIETPYDGLILLPARPELANSEVELVSHNHREFKLKSGLEKLDVEIVLIDCPPSLNLLTVNALVAATHVLIPAQAEYFALEGLGQLLETIQRVRQALNPNLKLLGVALTMYDSRTTLGQQVKNELERYLPGHVFTTVIPRNIRLAEAPSFGKPISEHDKWSKGAKRYRQLSKEVLKALETGDA